MRKALLFVPLAFLGCSLINPTPKKIQSTHICKVEKYEAPYWVCCQSTFVVVGKIYTPNPTMLKEEEAFSNAMMELIRKLENKTKTMLNKLDINDKKEIEKILNQVKDYTIVHSMEGKKWYLKELKMLYVQAVMERGEFKKFLKSLIKTDEKKFEIAFNESF